MHDQQIPLKLPEWNVYEKNNVHLGEFHNSDA